MQVYGRRVGRDNLCRRNADQRRHRRADLSGEAKPRKLPFRPPANAELSPRVDNALEGFFRTPRQKAKRVPRKVYLIFRKMELVSISLKLILFVQRARQRRAVCEIFDSRHRSMVPRATAIVEVNQDS